MKKRFLLYSLACMVLGVLLGAAIGNRTPLLRAFLQSDLDGNHYAITNLSGLQISTNAGAGRIPVSDTNGFLRLATVDFGVTNIVDAQIAAAAAIAKSKISTDGTWPDTAIP